MPRFTLRLAAAKDIPADEAASSFYWLTDQRSSFTPGIGPSLGKFGRVSDLNIDVVRIALSAFAADRSVLREGQGSNWNQRQFELEIPVSDPTCWTAVADELAGVLGFLSGDHWTLSFAHEQTPTEAVALPDVTAVPKRVVLLSGGADSAIGGLYSRSLLASDEHHR